MQRTQIRPSILLVGVVLAFVSTAIFADAKELTRKGFLEQFRTVLEERELDPLDDWAPGSVDSVIELLDRRLQESGITPTSAQLEALCASRRQHPTAHQVFLWHHPRTRRRRIAELVYEVEQFLLGDPADPALRQVACRQAKELIDSWSAELAESEPDAAAEVRRDARRLYRMFVESPAEDPASPEFARPVPPSVLKECQRTWESEMRSRRQVQRRAPISHMLAALRPLMRAARRQTLPPMYECEDYVEFLDLDNPEEDPGEVTFWEEMARQRGFRHQALRRMVHNATEGLPIPPGTVYGNTFAPASVELVEPFERALFRWDAGAMSALLEDTPGLEPLYEARWMQARLARAMYLETRSSAGAEPDEVAALAERCVVTAKAALDAAPGPFERACVTAEALPIGPMLEHDGADVSPLLSATLPAVTKAQKETGQAGADDSFYVRKYRPAGWGVQVALAEPMEPGPPDPNAPRPRKVADLVTDELARIAYIDYPWHVAVKLWEDVPAFLEAWLPIDAADRIEELRPSIRWYLWAAVTQHLPTRAEEKVIEKQVYELADLVGTAMNTAAGKKETDEFGQGYARRMELSYAQTRDNCLFPYWKRALRPRELSDVRSRVEALGRTAPAGQAGGDWEHLYGSLFAIVVEHGAPGVARLMPDGSRCGWEWHLDRAGRLAFVVRESGTAGFALRAGDQPARLSW